MEAFVLLKSVTGVALTKGDCFVQSPFHKDEFHLSRQPNRPPFTRTFIEQYSDLYKQTTVEQDEIPELLAYWDEQAVSTIKANELLIQSLEEQRRAIDERINEALAVNDKVKSIFWDRL